MDHHLTETAKEMVNFNKYICVSSPFKRNLIQEGDVKYVCMSVEVG